MSTEPQSIMSHMSIGTNDYQKAIAFYDKVLATIGAQKIMSIPEGTAYGKNYPEFWVQPPFDGKAATVGNGVHFSFMATSKEQVHSFYEAALEAGATDDGAPGPRPHYGEPYYGCFVRDLDGHKIEATFWDMELAEKLGMNG
ncbi:VOC family protein [Teredinibacter sp. KSP-S5-2]|uniref:VOC family protein n=1 Tax=Teredinibacter sp. KSP-S5-2 TaxID=3034506 RepID=UPI002934DE7E|nr:VOC family protein [Teredinibacter sp. KSP-S5-2]WNO08224.1 VOC family protein [Teredinibacter sp. KSP-S5-2]